MYSFGKLITSTKPRLGRHRICTITNCTINSEKNKNKTQITIDKIVFSKLSIIYLFVHNVENVATITH